MGETGNWAVYTFFGYTASVFVLAIFSHRLLKGRGFLKEYFLVTFPLLLWQCFSERLEVDPGDPFGTQRRQLIDHCSRH